MQPESPDQQPEHRPPTTPEEALAIFHSCYAEPKLDDGTRAELAVHEFDEGYLVYPVLPALAYPDEVPLKAAAPGGGKVVVSKEKGKTYATPNFPTEQAIALYKKNRARERNS
ncbi:hypothetical protein QIS99_19135 [Streptomyces sp. B-S-A8]|uniref:Uncharacterized protein n=1 Tax=Streptomyces solicavernae TaxID=3043614 RepID=A0ABT6RXC0_9ACTN|nr:hypothetical protein [Streptomyces sp. B-S-A8]MDI3388301.1 hypothetical protein [Streptomyces sp. B-S-A8]